MGKVHFILQGKGGVGKSMSASILAQFHIAAGKNPICVDTDPVNSTFEGYKALNVKRIDIMEGEEINSRKFDSLIEIITTAEQDQDIIIDNGAASFVPLSAYLISNDVPALLASMGHEIVVHSVVTGGQALFDTVSGFTQVVKQFPDPCSFVVWLNPYWGAVENGSIQFERMKAYTEVKTRVSGLIYLPELKQDTFGRDFSDMLKSRSTFEEALNSPDLPIMVKHRLKQTRDKIFSQLNLIPVI